MPRINVMHNKRTIRIYINELLHLCVKKQQPKPTQQGKNPTHNTGARNKASRRESGTYKGATQRTKERGDGAGTTKQGNEDTRK